MAEITTEEAAALVEFRTRVEDMIVLGEDTSEAAKQRVELAKLYYASDAMMLRYLMAKMGKNNTYKLDVSEQQFRDSIHWKVEEGVADVMLEWERSDMITNFSQKPKTDMAERGEKVFYAGIYGRTQAGGLLMVERTGLADGAGFSGNEEAKEAVRKCYIHYLENIWRHNLEKNSRGRNVLVLDLADLSMSSLRYVSLANALITMSTSYWPELTCKIYVINAGWSFQAIFAAVSPFLPERTKNKVSVLGSEYTQTLADLLVGGIDQLPDFLGGKNDTHGITAPVKVADVWPR
eukprot:m.87798 g.87798  ORF g.87798 m.87798 type:complete len:292 (+) comp26119_c0_seq2:142-1017(+)